MASSFGEGEKERMSILTFNDIKEKQDDDETAYRNKNNALINEMSF